MQRTLSYATHLGAFGWTPVVLTVQEGEHGFYDVSMLERVPDGLEIHRTPSIEPVRLVKRLLFGTIRGAWDYGARSGRPLVRSPRWVAWERWLFFPDRHLGWLPFALGRGLSICRRQSIDVVHSTSTAITSHLVAYLLTGILRIPWVADFQDPWADNPLPLFPSRAHARLARALEAAIIRRADRVTVTTEAHREFVCKMFPFLDARKFVAIPIGFDERVFDGVQPTRQGKFTIGHFGAFYGPRSPRTFLEALGESIRARPELAREAEVWFFGTFDALSLEAAERAIGRYGLKEVVRAFGVVPYREAIRAMASADVLLLVHARGLWGEKMITSKVFEYLGAGRPILALTPPGETARFLNVVGAGPVVDPDDVRAVRDAILDLHALWREGRLAGPAVRDVARARSWRRSAERFAGVLDEVCALAWRGERHAT
ncbi:MAG: glycosyltransferase [Armatimonadota bacterium]|nr:glycosyltransferase [Armatimonadota bacterium]